MGQARGGAPRAFLDLEFRKVLVRPSVIAAGPGFFSSRDWHKTSFQRIEAGFGTIGSNPCQ